MQWIIARLRCAFRRTHRNPRRHPLGGFTCEDCGFVGADLEEMGFENSAGVVLMRPFRRIEGGSARVPIDNFKWEKEPRRHAGN